MGRFQSLALELLDEPRVQLRERPADDEIGELARSIEAVGQLQPIGVVQVEGRFQVVYGHRRLLACRWLGRTPVDCIVLTADEAETVQAAAAENLMRRDLTPVEESRALRTLCDVQGRSVEQAARAVGRSVGWVRQRLEMLRWPAALLEHIERGELNVAVASELVRVDDEKTRAHYTRCAVDSGTTAGQVRQWRLDWEAAQVPSPGTATPNRPTVDVGGVRVPVVICECCTGTHPVTESRLMRICSVCGHAFEVARADGSLWGNSENIPLGCADNPQSGGAGGMGSPHRRGGDA